MNKEQEFPEFLMPGLLLTSWFNFICIFVCEMLDFDEPYFYQCYYFTFFKLMKSDCCPPPQKWKEEGEKKNNLDLQNLQTISIESEYFSVWGSQIKN